MTRPVAEVRRDGAALAVYVPGGQDPCVDLVLADLGRALAEGATDRAHGGGAGAHRPARYWFRAAYADEAAAVAAVARATRVLAGHGWGADARGGAA